LFHRKKCFEFYSCLLVDKYGDEIQMNLNSFAKIKSKSFRPLFSLLVKVIVTVWMRWLVIIHWKRIRKFQLNYFLKSLLYVVSIEFSTKRNRPTDLKAIFCWLISFALYFYKICWKLFAYLEEKKVKTNSAFKFIANKIKELNYTSIEYKSTLRYCKYL